MKKLTLWAAVAGALVSTGTGTLQAQTHVAITNLYFSEDFSSYAAGTLPTTEDMGGRWGTLSWTGPEGSATVVQDDQNVFGRGTQNQFFRVASTRNLSFQTPTFFPQEVAIFEFDYIGHVLPGDGARWLQASIRTGTGWAHITSARISNATIRTATTDVPKDPSYGGNDKAIRVWTVMNNGLQEITYDRPDGNGTENLPATRASVWLYHYETSTWQHLIPSYVYGRSAALDGMMLDNVRFLLDSDASLRSFDIDNVKVYGARQLLPPVHAGITNLLFKDDFNSYTVGGMPATTATGGKWATATWQGTNGTAAIVEDVNDIFGQGAANLYFQLSNTHNLSGLVTPVFNPKQDIISYAFDFVGHFYPEDGSRWLNVDVRNATGAAHLTSVTMSSTSIRGTSASYGPNDNLVRILTVLNNRQGYITYDRPDGAGTASLGPARASIWIRTPAYGWEQPVPEYIYSRAADFPYGAEIDRVRFYLDSNAVFRSLDLDNVEIYGTIKPIVPGAVLSAEIVGPKIQVRWMGAAGTTYQVQYRADLNPENWLNAGDPILAVTDGEQTFEENLAEAARFYRVEQTSP
jgi:hypothetical protein